MGGGEDGRRHRLPVVWGECGGGAGEARKRGALAPGSWILDLRTGPNPTDYPRTSANIGA